MTLVETIETAILANFAAESAVSMKDGTEILVAPDPEAVAQLAREIETAIVEQARKEFEALRSY